MSLFLGIDAGKTNLRVALFRPDLTREHTWATDATAVPTALAALRDHVHQLTRIHTSTAISLSTFGPLEVDPEHPHYGALAESSDPGWSHVNLPALLHTSTGLPVFFDFDVNAGALAEAITGAGQDLDNFVYLSIGTGIGAAVFRNGLTHGHSPQLGHMLLPREPEDTHFPGSCRFHGTCLQGLASGRALAQRWGSPAETLPAEHPAWDLQARYLASACTNLIYSFAPHRIILGSSVGCVPGLANRTNALLSARLNGFLESHLLQHYSAQDPIVSAALGPNSSLLGAALLAQNRLGLAYPPSPAPR